MIREFRRRLIRSVAVAALVISGTLVTTATPAQAYPTCQGYGDIFGNSDKITADILYICPTPYGGSSYYGYVEIQRQDPTTGAWTVLASGYGTITYNCVGTSTHEFRTGPYHTLARQDAQMSAPCY